MEPSIERSNSRDQYQNLLTFLSRLKAAKIYFHLKTIRDEAVLVEISVPGEKWEVECMDDGSVEVERFKTDGCISDEKELEILFTSFSD